MARRASANKRRRRARGPGFLRRLGEALALPWIRAALLALAVLSAWAGEAGFRAFHDQAAWYFLPALILAFLGSRGGDPEPAGKGSRVKAAVGLVLVAALGLMPRVLHLAQAPRGFYYDEAQNGLEAMRILRGESFPLFVAGRSQVPALFFWSVAASFLVFGVGAASVRAVSALSGAGTVPLLSLALAGAVTAPAAFLGALSLAGLRWSVNFSRVGFLGMQMVFMEMLALALLIQALKRGSLKLAAAAGAAGGLLLYSYLASPVAVALLFLVLAQALVFPPASLPRKRWRAFAGIFLLSLALVFAPLGAHYLRHPEDFGSRSAQVSLWAKSRASGNWDEVKGCLARHLRMFHQSGDGNGRHNLPGEPTAPAVVTGLALLGAGVALRRLREPVGLAPLGLALGMIQGGIWTLSWEAPQSYRTLGMIPALPWLGALFLDQVFRLARELRRGLAPLAQAAALGAVLAGAAYDLNLYFRVQAVSPRCAEDFEQVHAQVGRALAAQASSEVFLSHRFYDHPTVVFLSGRKPEEVFRFDTLHYSNVRPPPHPAQDAVYFLEPADLPLASVFEFWYGADAPATLQKDDAGLEGAVVIRVPLAARIRAGDPAVLAKKDSQGLKAFYWPGRKKEGAPAISTVDPILFFHWHVEPISPEYTALWEGFLEAPADGTYKIFLRADDAAWFRVDGREVAKAFGAEGGNSGQGEVFLRRGRHKLEAEYQEWGGLNYLEVLWQKPGQNSPEVIPASAFSH